MSSAGVVINLKTRFAKSCNSLRTNLLVGHDEGTRMKKTRGASMMRPFKSTSVILKYISGLIIGFTCLQQYIATSLLHSRDDVSSLIITPSTMLNSSMTQQGGIYCNRQNSFHPRVVVIGENYDCDKKIITRNHVKIPLQLGRKVEGLTTICDRRCQRYEKKSGDTRYHPNLTHYVEECQFMADWQMTFHPSCNMLHEVQLPRADISGRFAGKDESFAKAIKSGGTRLIWKINASFHVSSSNSTNGHTAEDFILKTLHYDLDNGIGFGYQPTYFWRRPDGFWMNRNEIMAMDALSSNPRVLDIYGACGHSSITETATDFAYKVAHDHWKVPKDQKEFNAVERLKIAVETALALSDLHSIDYANATNATLAHSDLHINNIVGVNGQWKIMDLNRAIPMKWNTKDNSPCGFAKIGGHYRWRAPESFPNSGFADPAKADIYTFGGILFFLLTGKEPFKQFEPKGQAQPSRILEGKRTGSKVVPHFPDEFHNSSDRVSEILYKTSLKCFQNDPNKRPTSFELAKELREAYELFVPTTTT